MKATATIAGDNKGSSSSIFNLIQQRIEEVKSKERNFIVIFDSLKEL
jgi:hypothetical protein